MSNKSNKIGGTFEAKLNIIFEQYRKNKKSLYI